MHVNVYLRPNEKHITPFNRHHRLPRCRGGGNGKNVVMVDEVSHGRFNELISATARFCRVTVRQVDTGHIAKFLNTILPFVERLLVDPANSQLKPIDQIAAEFNSYWLPEREPFELVLGATTKLRSRN